jgi:hypothetical protein
MLAVKNPDAGNTAAPPSARIGRGYAVAFANSGRPVTLNFIVVNSPDGWVILDVESPHDSLRMFLAQYRN